MSGRRLSRRAVLAGGAGSLAAACARRDRPLDRLRVSYGPLTLSAMYRQVAAAFEAAHPGITIELLPAYGYDEVMQRDFRLALVGDESDVSHVGLNALRFYQERDLAQPLDDFMAADPDIPLTTHPLIGRSGGLTRALPFAVSVPVSYFNADLMKRAGRDPEALLTADWPRLLDAAAAVSRLGEPISGIFFDYSAGSSLAWQMLVYGRGGRMMSPDERRVAFGDAAGGWSVRNLRALAAAGQRNLSRENARMAFAAGQLGCYQNTSANISRFSQPASGYRMIFAPLPAVDGVGRLPAAGNALVIPTRDPRRQALAWKYVRFAAGPVGQTIMAKTTGYLSLNRAAVEDPRFLKPVIAADPLYGRLYGEIDRLDAWYSFPGPRSEQVSQIITGEMREVLIGRSGPEAALSRMVEKTEQILRL